MQLTASINIDSLFAIKMSTKIPGTSNLAADLIISTKRGPSFELHQDDSYDFFRFDEDPDELLAQIKRVQPEALRLLAHVNPIPQDYYAEHLSKVVFGSNLIEKAGMDLEITTKFGRAIFLGEGAELPTGDRQEHSSGDGQAWIQVVQHCRALQHIVGQMVVKNEPVSEELILETHRILTNGLLLDDGASWTQ